MQASDIKPKLKELHESALLIEPGLAKRLAQIGRWIKEKPPNTIERKKRVKKFLEEFLADAETWIEFKKIASPEEKRLYLNSVAPAKQYWLCYLFPKWFKKPDKKFDIWRKKLMAADGEAEDEAVIGLISVEIRKREEQKPSLCQRTIADLSMATDLIASGSQNRPLCVQLTTVSHRHNQDKYEKWKETLLYWDIERGLFASYNPGREKYITRLANGILWGSDNIDTGSYSKPSGF